MRNEIRLSQWCLSPGAGASGSSSELLDLRNELQAKTTELENIQMNERDNMNVQAEMNLQMNLQLEELRARNRYLRSELLKHTNDGPISSNHGATLEGTPHETPSTDEERMEVLSCPFVVNRLPPETQSKRKIR